MPIRQKDRNRAELVQAIIKQNGGRIFTVVAKRKAPKVSHIRSVVVTEGRGIERIEHVSIQPVELRKLIKAGEDVSMYSEVTENFMIMTCRTGVKSKLAGGESTIRHKLDLISIDLTNGKGYRCFSAYNVLELRAGGTVINFKEQDVLDFVGE